MLPYTFHLRVVPKIFFSPILSEFFIFELLLLPMGFLVAQLVKNLPAIWDTWVQSLGLEDPLEKGKAAHFSILAWRIGVAKSWT